MPNFKNNKRNGFTLIELIVVILIMISIFILAIISFNDISKKNKEKAWEKVKNEVELAAKDYYEINSYKLGNLDDSSVYARVSVESLVENDFINVVTDPRNDKKVNSCDYVEVVKKVKKYEYKYYENKDNRKCDIEEVIIIEEAAAPSIKVEMSEKATGNDNYYIEPVDVIATIHLNNNGPIKEIKYKFNDGNYALLEINDNNKYEVPAIDGNSVTASFVATNILNNSAFGTITYKKDTVKPQVTSFVAKSTKENYNSNNIKLSWDIKDELSGLGDVNTNIKNNNDNNSWNKNGASSWNFDGSNKYFIGAASLNGNTIKPTLTVYDVAGNKTIAIADDYKVYKECSKLDEGTSTKGSYGKCSNTCGTGTKARKVTTTYKDKYTSKVCDTKTTTETASCTDKTGCTPFITNVSFRYNKEKCPIGHVQIKYKDINISQYTATMTYSHSVQGSSNTTQTDKYSDETFCRGWGLSINNIMSFEVTIINNLNTSKKATFKGTCDWSLMGAGANSNWHDCVLSK